MSEDKFGTMDLDQAIKAAAPAKSSSKSGIRPLPPKPGRPAPAAVSSIPAIQPPISLLRPVGGIAKRLELGEEAKALLESNLTVLNFLDRLVEAQQFPEALRMLAVILPKREGVWWAFQCIRDLPVKEAPQPRKATIEGIEKWLTDPSDENRRAANAAAEALGYGTPAGCLGLAVFCSGGSLGPADTPEVPPAEHLTAQTVANALLLAGVVSEPEKAAEHFLQYILEAIKVAGGMSRWKEPPGSKPSAAPAARPVAG